MTIGAGTIGSETGETVEAPRLTRRERQRLATYDEIVSTARELLRAGDEVSVRAVASAMGLTAPALYRYVEGHAGLLELVTRHILADVVADMGTARDRYPAADPAAQIVAAATAFRQWALTHPPEFRMVFASPPSGEATSPALPGMRAPDHPSPCGTEMFSDFFGDLFATLWLQQRFPVPAPEDLDPTFLELCRSHTSETSKARLLETFTEEGPGLLWLFTLCWARLYGIVAIEVFGHLDPHLITSGILYTEIMLDNGRALGIDHEWDRLQAIARTVSER